MWFSISVAALVLWWKFETEHDFYEGSGKSVSYHDWIIWILHSSTIYDFDIMETEPFTKIRLDEMFYVIQMNSKRSWLWELCFKRNILEIRKRKNKKKWHHFWRRLVWNIKIRAHETNRWNGGSFFPFVGYNKKRRTSNSYCSQQQQ